MSTHRPQPCEGGACSQSTHTYNLRPTPQRRAAAAAAELEADRATMAQMGEYLALLEMMPLKEKEEVMKSFFAYMCKQTAFLRRHQSFRQTMMRICCVFKKGPARYEATRLRRVISACKLCEQAPPSQGFGRGGPLVY